MIYTITELLLGVGCLGCLIWSNLTKSKTLEIILTTISVACLVFFFVVIGCTAILPERDTAEAAKIEISEASQSDTDIALQQLEVAKTKIEIAQAEAEANRIIAESITPEMLMKMLIEKWNGELPDVVGSGEYILPSDIFNAAG